MITRTVECKRFVSEYGMPAGHTWAVNIVDHRPNVYYYGDEWGTGGTYGPLTVTPGHIRGYNPDDPNGLHPYYSAPTGETNPVISVTPSVAEEDGPEFMDVTVTLDDMFAIDPDSLNTNAPRFYVAVWAPREIGDSSPAPVYIGRVRDGRFGDTHFPFVPPSISRVNFAMNIAYAYTANPNVIMLIGDGAKPDGSFFNRTMTVYGPAATPTTPTTITFDEPVEYLTLAAPSVTAGSAYAPFATHLMVDQTSVYPDPYYQTDAGNSNPAIWQYFFNIQPYPIYPTSFGSFIDDTHILYSAINDGDNVQVSRFPDGVASRELLAVIPDAKNPSLYRLLDRTIVCGYTSRTIGATHYHEIESSDDGGTFS